MMGYPLEIPRNDIVSYSSKFFSKVVNSFDGKKEWMDYKNVSIRLYCVYTMLPHEKHHQFTIVVYREVVVED